MIIVLKRSIQMIVWSGAIIHPWMILLIIVLNENVKVSAWVILPLWDIHRPCIPSWILLDLGPERVLSVVHACENGWMGWSLMPWDNFSRSSLSTGLLSATSHKLHITFSITLFTLSSNLAKWLFSNNKLGLRLVRQDDWRVFARAVKRVEWAVSLDLQ